MSGIRSPGQRGLGSRICGSVAVPALLHPGPFVTSYVFSVSQPGQLTHVQPRGRWVFIYLTKGVKVSHCLWGHCAKRSSFIIVKADGPRRRMQALVPLERHYLRDWTVYIFSSRTLLQLEMEKKQTPNPTTFCLSCCKNPVHVCFGRR